MPKNANALSGDGDGGNGDGIRLYVNQVFFSVAVATLPLSHRATLSFHFYEGNICTDDL